MQNDLIDSQLGSPPWYRTRAFRVGATILAAVAVMALVFFSQQIGDLLNLGGSRAAIGEQTIIIDGVGDGTASHFFSGDFSIDPQNSLMVGPDDNRLQLNPLGQ